METIIARLNQLDYETLLENRWIQKAAEVINSGQLVGFPTETVYGLGASVFSEKSIRMVYEVKGRPRDNPFIVHISNMEMLTDIARDVTSEMLKICNEFWPGPLTVIFKKSDKVPNIVTAGLQTVAIRMPSHPVALALIEKSQVPIAAPSANISGFPSPTTAEHVYHDLNGKIPIILDGGGCEVGVESTVIDLNRKPPLILRPGGLSIERLRKNLPDVEIFGKIKKIERDTNLINKPPSPGMKYRHYSPNADVILIDMDNLEIERALNKIYRKYAGDKKKIGIIHTHSDININKILDNRLQNEVINLLETDNRFSLSDIVARGIFAALRDLDRRNVEVIIVEGIGENDRGLAVMNRLRKAAKEIITHNRS